MSSQVLLGYDNLLKKISHVEIVGNALKVDNSDIVKLMLWDKQMIWELDKNIEMVNGMSC